ncbi:hypothetical protein C0995_002784 [Termitomyces sp. Mi166|nr:hypothetical protein C0995_002784 [Termitomyces sp. Mi166\
MAQAILRGITALVDHVRRVEKLADPTPPIRHSLTDTPIASIPCLTCGHSSLSALTILECDLEPPLDLPTFDHENDELVFLWDAVQPLCEQAQELQLLKDQLGQFAKEVTRVSQEVGMEGKLGGQALILDIEGTWHELTSIVNKLAARRHTTHLLPK